MFERGHRAGHDRARSRPNRHVPGRDCVVRATTRARRGGLATHQLARFPAGEGVGLISRASMGSSTLTHSASSFVDVAPQMSTNAIVTEAEVPIPDRVLDDLRSRFRPHSRRRPEPCHSVHQAMAARAMALASAVSAQDVVRLPGDAAAVALEPRDGSTLTHARRSGVCARAPSSGLRLYERRDLEGLLPELLVVDLLGIEERA